MISINQVSKFFANKAVVDNFSLEIAEGEHMVLLGSSGSGKTTLLKMINRLIEPTEGSISVNGKNIKSMQAHLLRRDIGYVLQANSLFPHYTVEENISVIPELLKWDRLKIGTRVTELMQKVCLPDNYRKQFPQKLSGGEAQRVNLARALAANPPVLLMDEPFSALDTITRTQVRNDFKKLIETQRNTVVLVTHDINEAIEIGDRIGLVHEGKLVQCGKPEELVFKPVNDFVKAFFHQNRLELELRVVKLMDLWPYLPVATDKWIDADAGLNSHTSAWQILEKANRHPGMTFHLYRGQQRKSFHCIDLFKAFNQYKSCHAI